MDNYIQDITIVPPECLNNCYYTEKGDIWQLGIVFL